MPTYHYISKDKESECDYCRNGFDYSQKMSDKELVICPECEGPIKKEITGGLGFILKGSGWYRDGYQKKPEDKKPKNALEKKL